MAYPGPSELYPETLTRSELSAMLEHIFYRADGQMREFVSALMPDAYARLTTGETMAPGTAHRVTAVKHDTGKT